MSKVDAQRAMKVARNARSAAGATAAPRPASGATRPAPERSAPPSATAATPASGAAARTATAPPTPAGEAGLCGHRNMAGKACRRPAGHAEKSHRYS